MMKHNFICASANVETPDPEAAGMPLVTKRMDGVALKNVISNSFGFGGTNCTLALSKVEG